MDPLIHSVLDRDYTPYARALWSFWIYNNSAHPIKAVWVGYVYGMDGGFAFVIVAYEMIMFKVLGLRYGW